MGTSPFQPHGHGSRLHMCTLLGILRDVEISCSCGSADCKLLLSLCVSCGAEEVVGKRLVCVCRTAKLRELFNYLANRTGPDEPLVSQCQASGMDDIVLEERSPDPTCEMSSKFE